MNLSQKLIAILFAFWAGMISAISFIEAWLKFKAPRVTREIGLGIGKLVFTALNRVELVLLLLIWLLLFQQYRFRFLVHRFLIECFG
ncbi:hypothetical protein [Carboxylicivirga sp. N1Y90]|uniref:hypothetical protein n=1 Tax=Carboxylicivirga fragile TaxID=3417571 RepID=UPI003D333474|nr:hypothetical protein [Marinilabiliaceae bacterium N1Y90]